MSLGAWTPGLALLSRRLPQQVTRTCCLHQPSAKKHKKLTFGVSQKYHWDFNTKIIRHNNGENILTQFIKSEICHCLLDIDFAFKLAENTPTASIAWFSVCLLILNFSFTYSLSAYIFMSQGQKILIKMEYDGAAHIASVWELESGSSDGHSWLHNKFKVSLGCCLQKRDFFLKKH